MIITEKSVNVLGTDGRVPSLSEELDFSGSEREGGVNNEPVKISW